MVERFFLDGLHKDIPLIDIIGIDGICGIKFLRYSFFCKLLSLHWIGNYGEIGVELGL